MSSERPRRSSVAPSEKPKNEADDSLLETVKQIVRDVLDGLEELVNPPVLVPVPTRPRRRR